MQEQQLHSDFKFKNNPFLIVAIGATLAFLPSIVGLLLLIFGMCFEKTFLATFFIQICGSVVMFIGFSNAHNQLKKCCVKKTGLELAVIGSILGIIANTLCMFFSIDANLGLNYVNFMDFILIILVLCISPVMAIAYFKLSENFTNVRKVGMAFLALSCVLFGDYMLWGASDYSSGETVLPNINTKGYYEVEYLTPGNYINLNAAHVNKIENKQYGYNDILYKDLHQLLPSALGMTSFVALLLALSATLFFVWKARLAMPYGTFAKSLPVSGSIPVMTNVKIVREEHLEENQKTEMLTAENGLINQLMSYDNIRLRLIMDKPALYTPDVVAKARELLARREAWEQIKDLTDEELMEMTMTQKGLYNDNIVEAASMELHQRDSRLLATQFAALSPDTVAAIASGAAPAPEGIRLAAQKYLSKK